MDRKTVKAVVIAVLIFAALCAVQEFASGPPHPDRPRNGIIGWILRGVIWHTIWGEPATPDEAPTDEPIRNAPTEPPRRAIAGGQEIPDYAEGW